eukprot:gnl/MRDRNA2_/MRDRNA2_148881_c0_seq1.p2 gnl/MRDRNA2_/MRDRNA2_148881_c0~~gnl/MRDRNA2_/MRDRNA2_148881_c0_seq1.p2  ORF type:complete len:385 (-),score=75.41 gnl/MRDRNA2_/MRDRNA2_148881_c0_seq1:14-1168(-)
MACQGMNDSAASHIMKVEQACRMQNVTLVLCSLGPEDEKLLQSWVAEAPSNHVFRIEASLRKALGFAEGNILPAVHLPDSAEIKGCDSLLARQALSKWLGRKITDDLFTVVESSEGTAKISGRESVLVTLHAEKTLGCQGRVPSSVFIAIPGYSAVQAEVETGTANRPAVLLSTTYGAICGVEGLIGMPSKGTWRTQSDSVFLKLDLQRLREKLTPETFGKLISEGFTQLGQQWDQLSALYTLAQGGGWHGVTYDETTKDSSAASEEYQKVNPTGRRSTVMDGPDCQPILRVHHDDGDHDVAAVLSRKTMVLEEQIQIEERKNDLPIRASNRKGDLEDLQVPILQMKEKSADYGKSTPSIIKRLSTMAFATSTDHTSHHMSDAA